MTTGSVVVRPHDVAVLALPGSIAFELGLPHRLLESAVDADGHRLYRVRVATLDGGPVRTSAGYSISPSTTPRCWPPPGRSSSRGCTAGRR
jgi:transcriptional regulator GlxA family with amidase domain